MQNVCNTSSRHTIETKDQTHPDNRQNGVTLPNSPSESEQAEAEHPLSVEKLYRAEKRQKRSRMRDPSESTDKLLCSAFRRSRGKRKKKKKAYGHPSEAKDCKGVKPRHAGWYSITNPGGTPFEFEERHALVPPPRQKKAI